MNFRVIQFPESRILIIYNPSLRPETGILTLISPEKPEDHKIFPERSWMYILCNFRRLLIVRKSLVGLGYNLK
jgi:hypothetical protein